MLRTILSILLLWTWRADSVCVEVYCMQLIHRKGTELHDIPYLRKAKERCSFQI